MKLQRTIAYVIIFQIFFGCVYSAGTLGGFEPITFPTSKKKIEEAVDTLFANHPEYRIPEKWRYLNNWDERGYAFLQSYIFYFESEPEEMYYVTYIGDEKMLEDTTKIQISIRAIENGKNRWLLHEDLTQNEKDRIYDGIISALIQLDEVNHWWLFSLVAWDLSKKKKVFSLKKLSEADASYFFSLLDVKSQTWPVWNASSSILCDFDKLTEQIATTNNKGDSEHYLILADDINNEIKGIKVWTYAKKLSEPDIDEIVDMPPKERQYWYDFVD